MVCASELQFILFLLNFEAAWLTWTYIPASAPAVEREKKKKDERKLHHDPARPWKIRPTEEKNTFGTRKDIFLLAL